MDDSGRVRITDFGLAVIPQDSARKRRFFDDCNVWWIAPEILHDFGTYSKEVDVLAFVMVMFKVCYGGIVENCWYPRYWITGYLTIWSYVTCMCQWPDWSYCMSHLMWQSAAESHCIAVTVMCSSMYINPMYLCDMTTRLLSSSTSYSHTSLSSLTTPSSHKVRLEYHVVYRIYSALLNRNYYALNSDLLWVCPNAGFH